MPESFSTLQKIYQITILNILTKREEIQGSDLAHFLEDGNKVKLKHFKTKCEIKNVLISLCKR